MSSHTCPQTGYHVCEYNKCNAGHMDTREACDVYGCNYNPYRMGATEFYGKGKKVDTTKPFTYVSVCLDSYVGPSVQLKLHNSKVLSHDSKRHRSLSSSSRTGRQSRRHRRLGKGCPSTASCRPRYAKQPRSCLSPMSVIASRRTAGGSRTTSISVGPW